MDVTQNPFNACLGIFYRPNRVFAKLDTTANWSWIPFILVMFFTLYSMITFVDFVDFQWYQDIMVKASSPHASPAEIANLKAMMTPAVMTGSMLIGAVVAQIAVNLIFALYLYLVSRPDEENLHGFTDWFGFMWWVNLPVVFTFIGTMLVMWLSDNHQVSLETMNPFSLAYWLDLTPLSQWLQVAALIRVETFFSIYLMAVGLVQFTRFDSKKAWTVAVIPFVVIFALLLFNAINA